MQGLMMQMPLLISSIAKHAERFHGDSEIVSVTGDNPLHRYTYRDCFRRSRQLANALEEAGMKLGDRVATLAWNDYRHLEAYYAISGIGAVCHTINPRLFPEQIVYIINHAEDRLLLTDPMFVPLLEKLADQIDVVERFVILTDDEHMPETTLKGAVSYDSFIGGCSDEYDWPEFDENTASGLCYTSGTTGNPKGVLYSHRSSVLHAYAGLMPDILNLSLDDTVLPVVPLFHVNAWGIPYAAPIVGAKLVFPGPKMGDGEALYQLMESEQVTISLGVPTVWLALLQYMDQADVTTSTLERTLVGGAAVPESMIRRFDEQHGVTVQQGWGMTETSPLGVTNTLKPHQEELAKDEQYRIMAKAGRGIFGFEMKIVDDQGNELPWDGKSSGALKVRGPWVCSDYFKLEGESDAHAEHGWFDTGDVAHIDAEGFLTITDRTKDVIKSGGEWISSIDLENAAMGHPDVAEAAVIGVHHPKWTERPLLIVVRKEGTDLAREDILEFLDGKVAKWWLPDDVVFVDELPHTATGKIRKTDLRKDFGDYTLPAEKAS